MSNRTITLPESTAAALDAAAETQHRDRNLIVSDAIVQYLAVDDEAFREQIEEGLRDAEAGRFVSHQAVRARIDAWADKANRSR